MNRQAGQRLADAAVELSRAMDVYRRRLEEPQRALFDRAYEQWQKHRDASCEFEASGVAGGSAHAMVHAECLTRYTRERLEVLRRLSTCEEGDLSCPAFLAASDPVGMALAQAAKQAPGVVWARNSAKSIDINCDGKPDYVMQGRRGERVVVAIVPGPIEAAPRAHLFEFGVNPNAQDSLCRLPAELKIESLDYDPKEAVGALRGFRRSKTCKAVALVDGACDSFHFYWNHDTNTPAWWRL